MSMKSSCPSLQDDQLVGDPVDVITGANVDRNLEFRLLGPLPFEFLRHYDSSKCEQRHALGRGQTHSYDRRLRFDADGITYVAPVGRTVGFPPLLTDGEEFATGGFILRRLSALRYLLLESGQPSMEFEFRDPSQTGRLTRLWRGADEIRFQHGVSGRLERIVDSAKRTIRVEEDPDGRLVSLTLMDRDGKPERSLFACEYDAAGNLVAGTDAYRNTFRFEYDGQNRMTRRIDRKGYAFEFAYDDLGRCIRSAGADGLHEVKLSYLTEERVTKVTRADGGEWTYFYNEANVLTLVIDPCGGAKKFVVDDGGRVEREMDPDGRTTGYFYDGTGRRTRKLTPAGQLVELPEPDNPPDPLAHRVPYNPAEYEYGWLIRPDEILLPDAGQVSSLNLSFEARQLVTTLDDPARRRRLLNPPPIPPGPRVYAGPSRGRGFDEFGKLVQQEGYDGRLRRWLYDPNGNIQRFTDFDGAQFQYEHRSWNLRVRETNPLGAVCQTKFTRTENTGTFIDAGNAVSEYEYDLTDRLVEVRRHGVVRERYAYTPGGALISKTDGNGQPLLKIENGPDGLPLKKELASGDAHTYERDRSGRLRAMATPRDTVEFAYDPLGQRCSEKRNGLGVEHRFWGWREVGRSVFFDRFVVRYDRLANGAIAIVDPGGREHRIRSLGHGLIQRQMANGTSELAQYDDRGRCLLKSAEHIRGKIGPWNRVHRYSGEGDLLAIDDSLAGTIRHEYDAAHRLKTRVLPNGRTENFELDPAGNLLAQPGLGEVVLESGNRLKFANATGFEYDARNHLSARQGPSGETRYEYDSRDMLVRAEINGRVWEADYDPLGRRTRKTWEGETTEFYWDTDRLVAEVRHDGRLRLYIYADILALTPILFIDYDSVDADPASGRRYYVFSDQVGTPVLVENEAGEEVWRATISPYGRAQIAPGAKVEMPLRFPGHYFDAETGLHYNRFRYYDPVLGRYLQSDPLGITGGDNLYAYPANPLAAVDVRGLGCPECEARAQAAREEKAETEQTQRLMAHPGDDDAVAAVARSAGMDPQDLANLQQHAQDRGDILVIRDTNPASLPHHDNPEAIPKPVSVKLNTDPQTGLVTRDQDWTPAKLQNYDELRAAGWRFDPEDPGYLRDPQGRVVYGDHDLQGAYTRDEDGTIRPRTTNLQGFQDDLNTTTGNRDMFQHGANDDYRNPDGSMGRLPGNNESFTVIDEHGRAMKVGPPTRELQDYYNSRGIPWPYPDYPIPPAPPPAG